MAKLKAESELQQSRLMEYEVASEHSEQQKTRLEEEVKELMKKVQEMEGVRHKKDLDATSKASELEGKVRFLSFILFSYGFFHYHSLFFRKSLRLLPLCTTSHCLSMLYTFILISYEGA